MGKYFLAQNPEAKVLQDVRSSKSIAEYLAPMGAEVHTWKVGRAYAAPKLREIDGLWGGELAGHYYFRDFFYSDSAIMAAQIILQVVAEEQKKGNTFADLIDEIRNYENSGEINFSLQQKKEAMQSLLHHFTKNNEHTSLMDFDGYRIEFPDWWFSIRASNTEPYLRLLVEAQSAELLATKRVEITNIIQQFK
jgi:phosphomannomutase